MDLDLLQARQALETGCTVALCRWGILRASNRRGILPVLEFLDSGEDFRGFSAADKVVGTAPAWLYTLLGVRAVYAPVMTHRAKAILEAAGIAVSCGTLTETIHNRDRSGLCPMEAACASCETAAEALTAIRRTLEALKSAK